MSKLSSLSLSPNPGVSTTVKLSPSPSQFPTAYLEIKLCNNMKAIAKDFRECKNQYT